MFLQGFLIKSMILIGLVNGSVAVTPLQPTDTPVAQLHSVQVTGVELHPVQPNDIQLHAVQPTIVKTWTEPNTTIL